MELDVNFKPSVKLAFFKELCHDKLSDEEIAELRVVPEAYVSRLVPFDIKQIKEWVKDDTTFLYLNVKDMELVYLEMDRPNLYRKLRELALQEPGEGGVDAKEINAQVKAIQATLAVLDRASTSRKQKAPSRNEANLEAKLLQSLPKRYGKLSEFELEVQSKKAQELLKG